MPRQEEARLLRSVGPDVFGRDARLTPEAADAWTALRGAAEKDGVRLLLLSAYRSISRQMEIVRKKLEAGLGLDEILQVSAYPGHSEHHTGRAIDIGSPEAAHLTEAFEQTAAFAWLGTHAPRFGFHLSYPRTNPHGIAFEPWHWCLSPTLRGETTTYGHK